jgi:hypothetical protein
MLRPREVRGHPDRKQGKAQRTRTVVPFLKPCAEAQLKETDAALEHLRTALTERPSLAQYAAEDVELEPLLSDPRFAALTTL